MDDARSIDEALGTLLSAASANCIDGTKLLRLDRCVGVAVPVGRSAEVGGGRCSDFMNDMAPIGATNGDCAMEAGCTNSPPLEPLSAVADAAAALLAVPALIGANAGDVKNLSAAAMFGDGCGILVRGLCLTAPGACCCCDEGGCDIPAASCRF